MPGRRASPAAPGRTGDELVREAEIVVEHQLPDGADHDAGDQDRQDEDRPVEDPAPRDPAAQQREDEAEHHLPGHRREREDGGVAEAGPEQLVVGERPVMGEADGRPGGLPVRPGHVVEARPDEVGERQHAQEQHERERRAEGRPAPGPVRIERGRDARARAGRTVVGPTGSERAPTRLSSPAQRSGSSLPVL